MLDVNIVGGVTHPSKSHLRFRLIAHSETLRTIIFFFLQLTAALRSSSEVASCSDALASIELMQKQYADLLRDGRQVLFIIFKMTSQRKKSLYCNETDRFLPKLSSS